MAESIFIALFGVFLSGISQVMLKKSALAPHKNLLLEYLNPMVALAYLLFFVATLCSTYAFRTIPLSMGPIIDATGYIYILIFGIMLFGEQVTAQKLLAVAVILVGILVYTLGV